ncbi:MAG: GNAT family N-acetyltransferase [Eubacterium sp.]|nr:GNAT family N-acetyltransferase [Eubacterium sp.]
MITKTGMEVEFKSADPGEAELEIAYLKQCCKETRYLLSEPEDIAYTVESEEKFISDYETSDNSLMLNAYVNGTLIGNGSFAPVRDAKRLSHRCSMGIALFREFCGMGIGELLLNILMEQAKKASFEIMELDVVTTNTNAIRLYEKLGFETIGERKRAIKYKDGTYADELLMVKTLL